ncbi:hypothetical protein [Marinifilum caeruleilacunae]|uniref:Uncharacterized protein n=1 Tax=Marinifilum caeruleilacunae TaxID=2499076 RepID=A0ABX1X1P2_9BACT|nr:hypothetical protein [Marinifilum caeruleilacunae]NOU62340.1 hypothetical protein [Marinifilum caeruleilacunae]
MNLKSLTLLFFSITLIQLANGQENFKSLTISSDSIKTSPILAEINNDSIVILEYKKIRYDDMPGVVDERVVYIDFQKRNILNEINKVKSQLESIINGNSFQKVYKAGDKTYKKITEKEIIKTYIPIHKLNGHYVAFLPDLEHPRIISDTAFFYKDDEGLMQHSIQEFFKENNTYSLLYQDFKGKVSKKEIKYYDTTKGILVWKETHVGVNDNEFINFRLYIPLDDLIKYPLLNIQNTGGLDDIYEKFDKVDLEKKFK